MKIVELSPLAFVARGERMTPGEQAASMAEWLVEILNAAAPAPK